MCGGTAEKLRRNSIRRGLSPRVRGNPGAGSARTDYERSIPACAGEPSSSVRYNGAAAVYPRVCGGTSRAAMEGFSM